MADLRICIDVDDLDRGIAFYTGALGLKLGRRNGPHWAELLGAACPIDLLPTEAGSQASPGSPAVRTFARHWTPVHLDFTVENLDAAVRSAVAAGAKIERDIEAKKWGRIAILADPFGHGFCLLEFRGRGYDEVISP